MFDSLFPKEWTTLQRLMWLKTNALARAVYEIITGNPVSFTAKAAPLRKLQVAFSPVQSLNGYDAPWPAGGGKNKFDKTVVSTGYIDDTTGELKPHASSKSSDYIPVSAGASYRIVTEQTIGMWGAWYDENKTYISGFANYLENPVRTAPTGAHYARMTVVYSNNGNVDTFAFNNPSTVTTWTPYANECPVSGWSSLTVEQRGKNLAHIGNAPIDETHNGCRLEINGASGHLSGTSTVTSGTLPAGYANHYVELPAGTYTLSSTNFAESGCYLRARWDVVSGSTIVNESGAPNGYTFTLTSSRKLYITVGVYGTNAGGFKENVDFDFEIQIELGNEKTDYAPYNPSSRSISITLPAVGKNLFHMTTVRSAYTWSDGFGFSAISAGDDGVVFDGTASSSHQFSLTDASLKLKAGTYRLSSTSGNIGVTLRYGRSTYLPTVYGSSGSAFTLDEDVTIDYIAFTVVSGATFDNTFVGVQIEKGTSATAFEHYTNTVYSGYVDVCTGVGEVTMVSVEYDGSEDENWTRHTSGSAGAFAMSIPINPLFDYPFGAVDTIRSNYLRSLLTTDTWGLYSNFISANSASALKMGVKSIDTVEAWKAYLAEHPLTVCYKIATPIPIQLTPQEVESLAGDNTMWTDGDSLTVEYRSN